MADPKLDISEVERELIEKKEARVSLTKGGEEVGIFEIKILKEPGRLAGSANVLC